MTFIFDLPNEQLIPSTFDLVEKIAALNIAELKTAPKDGETAKEAGARNLRAMAQRAFKEKPAVAASISDAMWVLDEKEKAPSALVTFSKCISRQDVMDFFLSLLTLV